MFWLLLFLLALFAAFSQVRLQLDVHHFDSTQARLRLWASGIEKTWLFALNHTEQGHQLTMTTSHGTRPLNARQYPQSRGRIITEAFLRADLARRFLLAHLHLDKLDGLILLRTSDAARSALLTGALRGMVCCIPAARRRPVRLRILPEFFRAHSTVQLRCIIRFRLGTLFLTAGMLLTSYLRQRLTESEAINYGTSHR